MAMLVTARQILSLHDVAASHQKSLDHVHTFLPLRAASHPRARPQPYLMARRATTSERWSVSDRVRASTEYTSASADLIPGDPMRRKLPSPWRDSTIAGSTASENVLPWRGRSNGCRNATCAQFDDPGRTHADGLVMEQEGRVT